MVLVGSSVSRRMDRIAKHFCLGGNGPRGIRRGMKSSSSAVVGSEGDVVFDETAGRVRVIKLNRPAKFNALDLGMVRLIKPRFESWSKECADDKRKLCVVLDSAGEKAFCAGGDVASIRENVLAGGSLHEDFFFEEYRLNRCIATAFEKSGLVQVSLWNGVTMGGGVGLSIHGKIRIATENTRFAMPETALGLFPDVGASYALPRLKSGYAVGAYLALTGARLSAYDCVWAGLATHYLPSSKLGSLKEELLSCSSISMESVDDIIRSQASEGEQFIPGEEKSVLKPVIEGIQTCFGHSNMEDIFAALEIYGGDWAQKTLKVLNSASPLSLKITLQLLKLHKGEHVTIDDALRNEYRVAARMCEPEGDFFEGVRAILIDKDNKPKWAHRSVSEVTNAEVDAFFEPLDDTFRHGELTF